MPLSAQTFTQQLQRIKHGGGVVTLHQDKAIDDLVNGSNPVVTIQPKKQTQEKPTVTAKQTQKKETAKAKQKEEKQAAEQKTDNAQAANDPTAEQASDTTYVKKPTYKVMGYRVQAFAGGNSRKDKHKAEEVSTQLRALFPSEQVYMHFYSPRWICRIGNYRTYEEAHKMLQEVRGLGYTSATIVKGKISVPY